MEIKDVLDELGIEHRDHGQHHHTSAGWLQLDCPFCSPGEGRFRLGYNLSFGYCSCWTCGPKQLISVLREATGKNYRDLKALLGDLKLGTVKEDLKKRGTLELPKTGELKRIHLNYLKERGFDPKVVIGLWKVKGIGLVDGLAWRIFIPVHLDGEVVSWTTRATNDKAVIRYKTARHDQERVSIKDVLYGEDYVRNTVIVCEGPLDVWKIGPGAVATCGTSYSRKQLLRLSRFPYRYVCFDNEPDAQRRARKLVRELEVFDGETANVTLDSGKDPGEASPRELKQLRKLLV